MKTLNIDEKVTLNMGEEITYNGLLEKDSEYSDLIYLKSAEVYKRNCLRIKEDKCIYCARKNLSIMPRNTTFARFKCNSCKRTF